MSASSQKRVSGSADPSSGPLRICFVCSGNICRSPTAELVFKELAAQAGRSGDFLVDSAGIGDWHVGAGLDERSRGALAAAGYPPRTHTARQFRATDFNTRNLVVAIDHGHLEALTELATIAADPESAAKSLVLLRAFDPVAVADGELDVPDPYYGGPDGFKQVLGQIERACSGLLEQLSRPLG